MMKYKITLSKTEHDQLIDFIAKGVHKAQLYRTAYILLNCDEGEWGDKSIGEDFSKILKVSMLMIDRVKQRFIEEGFEAYMERSQLRLKIEIYQLNYWAVMCTCLLRPCPAPLLYLWKYFQYRICTKQPLR